MWSCIFIFFFFFLTIFKVFIEFITILFLFYFFWWRGMWDPGSLTRSPIWVPCNGSVLTTGQPGKFPSNIIISFWRPKNFSLIPTLALCTQEGAAAGKAGTSRLSCCTILQAGECRVENVLQDGVKPRMTPQASRDWLLSLATPASAFQFILRPQLAPSWLCPGQTDRRRRQGWALAPGCTEEELGSDWAGVEAQSEELPGSQAP